MHIIDTTMKLSSQHNSESQSIRQTLLAPIDSKIPAQLSSSDFDRMYRESLTQKQKADSLPTLQPINVDTLQSEAYAQGSLLTALLEMLLGQRDTVNATAFFDTTHLNRTAPSTPQWRFVEAEQIREHEQCQFNASGKICLADGSERQFDVSYAMDSTSETTRLTAGQAVFRDPLVLDFGTPQANLTEAKVAFDLDSDGKPETMHAPGQRSGVLFYDRNHNGVADNGRELFGPQTGNGFAELAKLDDDGNGWIDSADTAFADLKLWRSDGRSGGSVQSLADAGVGALSTNSVATPFTLKHQGETVGMQRASGVWLGEHEGGGSLRQIDVVTTPINDQRAPT